MPTAKPHIILIQADQLAPHYLPAYGHKTVIAPNLQRLAEHGVVFDAAYTNMPLCAPSRYSMMTGRLPTQIAAWDNSSEWSSEVPTYGHYLHELGYRSVLSGKMHFVGADQMHGYDERTTTDVYPSDFGWHPLWDEPDKPLSWYHNMNVVYQAGVCVRANNIDYDDEALYQAKRKIFNYVRSNPDYPLMLTLAMIQPHDPYLARAENWDLYRDDDIDMPHVADGSVELDAHSKRIYRMIGAQQRPPTEAQIRAARRAYYATITDIDHKVGQLMQTLNEAKLLDNSIIIFTSDHGDMLGEKGLWYKMSFLERSARVPLIVHAPARLKPSRVSEAVSLVDLLPTLMDLACDGKPTMDYVTPIEGRSLFPHLHGDGGHDEVIGEYCAEGALQPMFMIRRKNLKYICQKGDPALLFDLDKDPHELSNLAASQPERVQKLNDEASQRWNNDQLVERIMESQRRRRLVAKVLAQQGVHWDYEPRLDASHAYIRNNMSIYEIERRARFPAYDES